MNFQKYNELSFHLSIASEKKNNNQDYSSELNNACETINRYVETSKNKIITAWEIERTCLVYDRNCSIDKDRTKLNSRFTGCLGAIKDYKDLTEREQLRMLKTFQHFSLTI